MAPALEHGWRPRGTTFDPGASREMFVEMGMDDDEARMLADDGEAEWRANYLLGDRQRVSAEDAAALTAALEQAAGDIPGDGVPL